MFAGGSEISISVTVKIIKEKKHVGIIKAFCLSGGTY